MLTGLMIIVGVVMLHVTAHELGHAGTAIALGAKLKRFGVTKFGAPYTVRSSTGSPFRDAIVALAGPAANLVTCVVLVSFHAPHAWDGISMAVINLLPWKNSDLSKCLLYLKKS